MSIHEKWKNLYQILNLWDKCSEENQVETSEMSPYCPPTIANVKKYYRPRGGVKISATIVILKNSGMMIPTMSSLIHLSSPYENCMNHGRRQWTTTSGVLISVQQLALQGLGKVCSLCQVPCYNA